MRWLKKALRRWLEIPEASPDVPRTLAVTLDGEIRTVAPTGVVGLHLRVRTPRGERLVGSGAAVDPAAFWAAWRRLRGDERLVWEDGEPFIPGR